VAASILFRRRRVLGGHPANLCMSASRDDGVSALKGGCSCGGIASLERSAPAVAAPCRKGAVRVRFGGLEESLMKKERPVRRRGESELPTVFKVGEIKYKDTKVASSIIFLGCSRGHPDPFDVSRPAAECPVALKTLNSPLLLTLSFSQVTQAGRHCQVPTTQPNLPAPATPQARNETNRPASAAP